MAEPPAGDGVELPVFSADTPASQVWAKLKAKQRSGFLLDMGGRQHLFSITEVRDPDGKMIFEAVRTGYLDRPARRTGLGLQGFPAGPSGDTAAMRITPFEIGALIHLVGGGNLFRCPGAGGDGPHYLFSDETLPGPRCAEHLCPVAGQ